MDPLAPLITALHSEGRLRVWSMIITVFGDLVQHRGGEISTARLGRLLGRVGVEQGALRTALSRLGRDGWVDSERSGRTSLYRLSAQGLNQFAPATTRIYAAPRAVPVQRWAIALRLGPLGKPEATLSPADEVSGGADCLVAGALEQVSEAYRAALLSPAHRAALVGLAADLQALAVPLPTALDAAAARMLLIHRWRRLVLRFPDIPADLMPDDAPLVDPRRAVADIYAQLVPATEDWLEGESPGLPPMASPITSAALRFAGVQSGVQSGVHRG
ncbi:MAG: phenylacetic acid degradation operon negative regulatory protein [Paracoccaceae bacterium]|jgi:phenylacetic acid degradation operon negative regulatory protein